MWVAVKPRKIVLSQDDREKIVLAKEYIKKVIGLINEVSDDVKGEFKYVVNVPVDSAAIELGKVCKSLDGMLSEVPNSENMVSGYEYV